MLAGKSRTEFRDDIMAGVVELNTACTKVKSLSALLGDPELVPQRFFLKFLGLLSSVTRAKRGVIQARFVPLEPGYAEELAVWTSELSFLEGVVWGCRNSYSAMMTRLAKGRDFPGARFEVNPVPKVVPVEDTILMTDPQIVETGQALVDHFTVALQFLQKVQDFVSPPYVGPLPDTLLDSRVTLLRRVDDELASGGS